MAYGLVLAPCAHADSKSGGQHCAACYGSGWVSVVPGPDGEPRPCAHANTGGKALHCGACYGSGWAGLVRDK